MCSCSPHVILVHLLGLLLGLVFIHELVRWKVSRRIFWAAVSLQSIVMTAFVFQVTRGILFSDFLKAYWVGGATVLQDRSQVLDLYNKGIESFVNIPVVTYLFAPLSLASPMPSALLFTLIGLAGTAATWFLSVKAANLDTKDKGILLFLFASFGPLLYSIREGNTTHIVLLGVVASFLLLRMDRNVLAGAILGMAAIIKLPLLLFGVYFVVRGQWRVVIGGGAAIGAAVLLSLALFGWNAHLIWYESSVLQFGRDPLPALNVQSVASALARLELGPVAVLDWTPHQLSTPLQLVASASTFLLLAFAVVAVMVPRPADGTAGTQEVAREIEYLIVLMLACIISPLSWSHYYAWMLMPIAFFIGKGPHFSHAPLARCVGWISIVVGAAPMMQLYFGSPFLEDINARLGTSRLLFAGLLMLGLLIWSRWRIVVDTTDVSAHEAPAGNGRIAGGTVAI